MIVVDDENGNIEGNIVFGASFATPETIGFVMRHGSGIISVGMTSDNLERLNLPLMTPETENKSSAPSFTVTVVLLHNYFIKHNFFNHILLTWYLY